MYVRIDGGGNVLAIGIMNCRPAHVGNIKFFNPVLMR